jgi:hypothetical protein
MSVGRHDLDGTGQVVDRAAVEEATVVRQADVGQQAPSSPERIPTGAVRRGRRATDETGGVSRAGPPGSERSSSAERSPV